MGWGQGGEGTPYPKLTVSSFIIYFAQNLTELIFAMLHFPEERLWNSLYTMVFLNIVSFNYLR